MQVGAIDSRFIHPFQEIQAKEMRKIIKDFVVSSAPGLIRPFRLPQGAVCWRKVVLVYVPGALLITVTSCAIVPPRTCLLLAPGVLVIQ